jgi:two-component system phosphate regulon sensor histidine kinase PhoR
MTTVCILLVVTLVIIAVLWWRERMGRRKDYDRYVNDVASVHLQHEAALGAHAERLQAVLDSMVEGILVLDAQNHVAIANRTAGRFFGFSHGVLGRALIEVARNHEILAIAERLKTESSVLGYELRLEETPPRFLEVNGVMLRDLDGASAGAVLVFHDISRVRELEGVRQEFVANVSHELRTPLSLIKGATETLLDGARNDPVALERLLTIVDRHANRLTLLIDDLLLLAKLDAGRVVFNLQPAALRLAVQEVAEDLTPRAKERDMRIENTLPSGLIAQADTERLRQVLSNLIDNAIKYGRPAGKITISGRALDEKFVEVCVQDDGPGISPESRPRVFERFYRADKARSREQGGTGLGLAIVKHVVQRHGGDVRVESEPGQGAAFYFTLPR